MFLMTYSYKGFSQQVSLKEVFFDKFIRDYIDENKGTKTNFIENDSIYVVGLKRNLEINGKKIINIFSKDLNDFQKEKKNLYYFYVEDIKINNDVISLTILFEDREKKGKLFESTFYSDTDSTYCLKFDKSKKQYEVVRW